MMDTKNNKLDEIKSRQPFRVPEGYFDNFTEEFMSRLPEKHVEEPKKISFSERVKPWLYMAAAFAGILILFNVFNLFSETPDTQNDTSVKTASTTPLSGDTISDEDAEFLEYIEDMYTDKYAISYIVDDFME